MALYEGAGFGATLNFLAGTADLSIADALRRVAARFSYQRLDIPVGYYWQTDAASTPASSSLSTARRGYFTQFIVPFPMSIDELRFSVASSGGVLHAGIYDVDSSGMLPGALVADLGVCADTAIGTGPKGYTGLDVTFERGGIYWMMVTFDAATSLHSVLVGPTIVTADTKASLTTAKGYYSTSVIVADITDPLPSTAPALTVNPATSGNQLIMEMRRSA